MNVLIFLVQYQCATQQTVNRNPSAGNKKITMFINTRLKDLAYLEMLLLVSVHLMRTWVQLADKSSLTI
jgi:hypothetical protein